MGTQYPLSFQQQWLWSLLRESPHWKSVITAGFRLLGSLDVAVLRRSFAQLIQRHASLRTRIFEVDGSAVQWVDEIGLSQLDCVEVSGGSEAEVEDHAKRLFAQFSDEGVDVALGPLFRGRLLRLSEGEHWLLTAVHRLVGECFTAEQIAPELWSIYADFFHERPAALSAEPPQYCNYALWQHKTAPEWVGRHQDYWNRRLAGAQRLQLPVEVQARGVPREVLGRMNAHFGGGLSEALRELARKEHALLANVMLAVHVATLWRRSQQRDFVVPVFVAGRQSEHKAVLGCFSHILYLRMELPPEVTGGGLLKAVSNEFYRALSHQDFGQMALREPGLLAGNFFQWITWHPQGAQTSVPLETGRLSVERVSVVDFAEDLTALPAGVVDMELTCFDTPEGIYASGVYRADLFTRQTMEGFMADLQAVARRFVEALHAPVAEMFVGRQVGTVEMADR